MLELSFRFRFIRLTLVPESDTALCQIIGRHLQLDLVTRQYLDIVHAHLARDGSDDHQTVLQLDAKHGVA